MPKPDDAVALVRTAAAYSTLLPSMLTGVAAGLIRRDRNQVAQFGVNAFVGNLFALTGVKLEVRGEEHLWSSRPAVFIYNHRNNFDPYIAIRLVRSDWGSVGKREIAGPLAGFMQWLTPNVAYIDRTNHDRAVEGLSSVATLLGRGVSILIAPEGTRSRTGELGDFKKGAFRMAMDAHVPLVPIVIHDADQVSDREGMIIRNGTVHVTVLPSIDVTDWKPKELDKRVSEVRALFLETLERPVRN